MAAEARPLGDERWTIRAAGPLATPPSEHLAVENPRNMPAVECAAARCATTAREAS
ncbi:MAG: hypothetical protein V8Q54_08125 [Alistipes senegalensis]